MIGAGQHRSCGPGPIRLPHRSARSRGSDPGYPQSSPAQPLDPSVATDYAYASLSTSSPGRGPLARVPRGNNGHARLRGHHRPRPDRGCPGPLCAPHSAGRLRARHRVERCEAMGEGHVPHRRPCCCPGDAGDVQPYDGSSAPGMFSVGRRRSDPRHGAVCVVGPEPRAGRGGSPPASRQRRPRAGPPQGADAPPHVDQPNSRRLCASARCRTSGGHRGPRTAARGFRPRDRRSCGAFRDGARVPQGGAPARGT